jgi:hypothetical protein
MSETIQFYDFNDASPDLSVFDVSSCYSDMAKLHFNVRFPGTCMIHFIPPTQYLKDAA